MNPPILLIVDDEKATRDGLRMALEDDFDCYVASDIAQAKIILQSENVDVMLTDLRMGSDNGMDLLEYAQKRPHAPVAIMMTAYGSVDTAVEAMRRGAWHFVTKPLNLDEVELLAKRALTGGKKSQQGHNISEEAASKATPQIPGKPSGLNKLLGQSPAMARVHAVIEQVAPTKTTVLIEGESGTGKELVAQAMHQLSSRSKQKMITVNCAALSPQLLESELFGHEKGAFTGATQKRIGRFEQANGGSIFLDEIGEIDASTQVKLLRVLSERTIERVGSSNSQKVDVRIITATNKNLEELVERGEFREDLYFRLNVVKVTMPPLRDREGDVELLTQNFLQEFAEENERPVKPLSEHALKVMNLYSWPGNVRELRTTIEHGVVMSNEDVIKLNHLPSRIQVNKHIHVQTAEIQAIPSKPSLSSFNLAELERKTIRQALEKTANNRTEAARLLGISRRTLHRKINSYNESE